MRVFLERVRENLFLQKMVFPVDSISTNPFPYIL
jgi:hypothetical protein